MSLRGTESELQSLFLLGMSMTKLFAVLKLCPIQVCPREIRQCRKHIQGSHRPLHLLRPNCEIQDAWDPTRRFPDLQPEMGRRVAYV